ncbi:carboxy terminal-processing peptidase [Sulfuriroseicoccus oceanibius]|uniref:Carboxy terminal-processing peptidase n=1 Tax=Sulfuriroseicoccus oceanibius TaxID=2707525 RepID=A0A6B3L275_9BACT|nr:carboxy terminal-processing peptidase [Sulfuriroseicoccus oceanibius]QQL44167.1 carboxy terminal-processing peptidase [Sulfuriroseicoccus oceanibius]
MRLRFPRIRTAIACALVAITSLTAPSKAVAATNYNEVGRQLLIMLRNMHFEKRQFTADFQRELLTSYLEFVDMNKLYFLQSDVDEFQRKYGGQILVSLLKSEGVDAAAEIHERFVKRVTERNDKITELIKNGEFNFDGNETIELSREDADWPADAAEADAIWHKRIEESMLEEVLRQLDQSVGKESDDPIDPAIAESGEWKEHVDLADAREKLLNRYRRILENVQDTNLEDVADMFFSSIAGMYDPHSDYFSFSEEEQFRTSMENKLTGIGALLQSNDDGSTQIKGIVVGGPTDKAGALELDDKIIGVDHNNTGEMVDITYMKIDKVVELIRGDQGTTVRLKVIPAADETTIKEVTIVRDTVELKDNLATGELIHWQGSDDKPINVGWITVPSFYRDFDNGTTSLTRDVHQILKRQMAEGIDGLVIDLRGNGGGSLDEAVEMTGLFIPSGPVVQAKNTFGHVEVRRSSNRFPVYDGPLIVLTDKTSASASEIFAAALQDYNRALIVGDKSTFGKGTVQTVAPIKRAMPLLAHGDRAGTLKVTIQKFYRIAGGSTQLKGVEPDIVLPSRLDALEIGEDALTKPLPHDSIKPQTYKAYDPSSLARDLLAKRSAERIAASQEFQYIVSDIDRLKSKVEENELVINLRERLEEKAEMKELRDARRAEQKARFAQLRAHLEKSMVIKEVSLDTLKEDELPVVTDFTTGTQTMRQSPTEDADDAEKLEYPFGLSPAKREALFILSDILKLGQKQELPPVTAQLTAHIVDKAN